MATLSYLTNAVNGADASSFTFSSQTLGTAAADRYIIVHASGALVSGTGTINSVTVGGVSATEVVGGTLPGQTTDYTSIWIAAVPTGTTGDVVVAFPGTARRCGIALYRATGLNSATAFDTITDATTAIDPTVSDTINNESGGVFMAAVYTRNSSPLPTMAWTGVTEDYEATVEGNVVQSGGLDDSGTARTTYTVQCDVTHPTTATSVRLVGASWSSAGGGAVFTPKVAWFG